MASRPSSSPRRCCAKAGAPSSAATRAEAAKDRADRQAILEGLERQLVRGDKALIGNSAYRRSLRRTCEAEPAFEIDPASLAEEAKFDGVFVLRDLHPSAPAAGDAALS